MTHDPAENSVATLAKNAPKKDAPGSLCLAPGWASECGRVVLVYPVDKWLLMLIAAGAQVRNLGDVRWCATEDGSQGKGTGRHIAAFILDGQNAAGQPTPGEKGQTK